MCLRCDIQPQLSNARDATAHLQFINTDWILASDILQEHFLDLYLGFRTDQDMLTPLSCADCYLQHEQAWDLALHHVFLNDCKHDNIRKSQFDTWLVQDFLFVREFTRLAANLLSVAPYSDFDVLLGGLVALKSELTWFEVRQR